MYYVPFNTQMLYPWKKICARHHRSCQQENFSLAKGWIIGALSRTGIRAMSTKNTKEINDGSRSLKTDVSDRSVLFVAFHPDDGCRGNHPAGWIRCLTLLLSCCIFGEASWSYTSCMWCIKMISLIHYFSPHMMWFLSTVASLCFTHNKAHSETTLRSLIIHKGRFSPRQHGSVNTTSNEGWAFLLIIMVALLLSLCVKNVFTV